MTDYTTPKPFNDLFFDFTGYAHANYPPDQLAIAKSLSEHMGSQQSKTKSGPLIVANSVGIYVYDNQNDHKLLASGEYRAKPNSGFYEVTSISHVGPAIAYLGVLQKNGSDTWQQHLAPLLEHIQQVQEVNAKPLTDHWLTQLDCAAWQGKEAQIRSMIDYACELTGHYLSSVIQDKSTFNPQHILKHFLEVQTDKFPIPYNTVMIGTFSLAGLKSAYDIYQAIKSVDIDWSSARVLLHNLAGTNYGAGLTQGSNWLLPLLKAIAGDELPDDKIFIVPYAPEFDDLGMSNMCDDLFHFFTDQIWGSLYARPMVMNEAFANVKDIIIPKRDAIPGDYDYTKAEQIDHFIQRLKFSTGNVKEMLSNSVGFWLAGEAKAKNWDLNQMAIPGLTHGLPKGFKQYPSNLPAA